MARLAPFVRYHGKWYRRNRLWGVNGLLGPAERFTWREYDSHDGVKVPERLRVRVVKNARGLNNLRRVVAKAYKVKPVQVGIKINSGYRSPTYNKRIGGARFSQHKEGRAADIQVFVQGKKIDSQTVGNLAESVTVFHRGGIGVYDESHGSFTHVDTREDGSARWHNG